MKKIKKLQIGRRYYMDNQKDISGLYFGLDERDNYLFGAMYNNYLYLTNNRGEVVMPSSGVYEKCEPLILIIK